MQEVKMMDEWKMWQRVVALLQEQGVDINKTEALGAAIVLWGETLVDLRIEQLEEVRQSAYDAAIGKWNRAVTG